MDEILKKIENIFFTLYFAYCIICMGLYKYLPNKFLVTWFNVYILKPNIMHKPLGMALFKK